jgi:hypothetical protein
MFPDSAAIIVVIPYRDSDHACQIRGRTDRVKRVLSRPRALCRRGLAGRQG